MNKITSDEFIHACYVPKLPDGTDAVVVKVHRHHADGTVVPELIVVDKPVRSFYITQPSHRTHEFKKEWEESKRLDRYLVPNHRLAEELNRALNGNQFGGGWKRPSIPELCNSPYIYGADVHIDVLVKAKYNKDFTASGCKATQTTSGFLDIETDVVGGDGSDPNIITVTHENRVYTAILEKFLTVKNPDGSFRRGNLEEFVAFSKHTLEHHINALLDAHVAKNKKSLLKERVAQTPFEYFYYVGKTMVELVRWIFARMHENRTDFVGVWNLDFDIPKIIDVLVRNDIPLEEVFCPPELPARYRYAKYKPDDTKTANIYKKWHWMHNAGYTQFIDSMCLYSLIRTVKGIETSMALDAILKVNDLGGKLTFKDDDPATEDLDDIDWHRYMQKHEAYKYIVYNQFDCISMQLMEWKNLDLWSMSILGGVSRLCKWTRQTRKVADALYFDALDVGMVTASPGTTMETEFDRMIGRVGGTVLRPERTIGVGLRIFSDMPRVTTMLHNMVGDFDFSQMYPTITAICGISKETKISTGLSIGGLSHEATHSLYSQIIAIQENAVLIGADYFGLPNYSTMADRFRAFLVAAK